MLVKINGKGRRLSTPEPLFCIRLFADDAWNIAAMLGRLLAASRNASS
ncbi:hypothetical protein CA13_61730 [Planctomycetes bacterium CA13]|uniref:Uncharacterized protein n=1 Tax=Novipirellula herctigrandis TaxID=2527986 RepID=A0A5C5ZDT2_9BACT|nr:hypothetical protein CA13_61730 [Planctomycetes bacterium CA13]